MQSKRIVRAGTLVVLGVLTMAAQGFAQCSVSGPSAVCPGSPAVLCASPGVEFHWTGPNGFTGSTQCVTVTAPGTYSVRAFDGMNGLWFTCAATLGSGTAPATPTITGPTSACEGETVQLCGPTGTWTYAWTGPDGYTASTACADVSASGTYTLAIGDPATGCTSAASTTVTFAPCGGGDPLPNCPRTAAWWARQCRPSARGPKVTVASLDAVAACVDARATSLAFDGAAGFCDALGWDSHRDVRAHARRQLAALFANLCAHEQGLTTPGGAAIGVAADAAVKFEDEPATTVGAWAAAADARMASLANRSVTNRGVRRQLERITWSAGLINMGLGIDTQCKGTTPEERIAGEPKLELQVGGVAGAAVDLAAPSPNPFRGRTSLALTVDDGAGADVDVAVYDLAGRRLRTLLSGHLSAGVHEASWDGRTDRGDAVTPGVYFVRGRAGGETLTQSVILAR